MSVHDLLGRLRDAMRTAGVQHMLTGSYASSVHGTPRASQDIDIVIAPTRPQLLALLQLFPDTEYYVSQEAALDALATRGKFNVIDFASGWKIDFIIMKAREFSTELSLFRVYGHRHPRPGHAAGGLIAPSGA